MRIAALVVFTAAFTISISALPPIGTIAAPVDTSSLPAASPTVQQLFDQFGLFGSWAINCNQSASPDNPHVSISAPSPDLVLEDHNLGSDYDVNRYSVLSAKRLSETRLSVEVLFQPGTDYEQRQKLVFLIRDGTRRTLFNQPDGGPVRVRDGIALARGVKTPVLTKCE